MGQFCHCLELRQARIWILGGDLGPKDGAWGEFTWPHQVAVPIPSLEIFDSPLTSKPYICNIRPSWVTLLTINGLE